MKHLDRLLLKSFLGPFFVVFGIAWFVLLMQFLWFFVEKIADKGLPFGLVLELVAYRAVGLIPLALPLAALVAGVMVIGGLAERFELVAFQSAGGSLKRILFPLVVVGVFLSLGSYLTADYLVPAANLKFLYRLADVQRKKPALSLRSGVFNEDLKPYAFYAAGKDPDRNVLTDVLLYDRQDANGSLNQISAARGVFDRRAETKELQLTLHDGVHYQQPRGGAGAPLVRTEFRTYGMVFDLSQFDLVLTPDQEKSTHYALLTTWQLQQAADSVGRRMVLERDTFTLQTELIPAPGKSPAGALPGRDHPAAGLIPAAYPRGFVDLTPAGKKRVATRARSVVRGLARQAAAMANGQKRHREGRNRFLFEKHAKLALAVVCVIFVVVGGATGAIVRRGGFGYPLLVSTGCFISYVLLLEFCKRLMKTEILTGAAAGWIPVACLVVVAGLLLRRAAVAA